MGGLGGDGVGGAVTHEVGGGALEHVPSHESWPQGLCSGRSEASQKLMTDALLVSEGCQQHCAVQRSRQQLWHVPHCSIVFRITQIQIVQRAWKLA
jgi:hypothetical protein